MQPLIPPIVFKINDFTNESGYANKLSTIIYNLNNIDKEYYEDFKLELSNSPKYQLIKFEVAGRYVVVIEMKKGWEVLSMLFLDFKKNDESAKLFMQSILIKEDDEQAAKQYGVPQK